jgi:hypothetical protein
MPDRLRRRAGNYPLALAEFREDVIIAVIITWFLDFKKIY